MRWQTGRQSSNVQDRRGVRTGATIGGGSVLLLILLAVIFKQDPRALLQQVQMQTNTGGGTATSSSPEEEQLKQFMSAVLADTEDVWHQLFRDMGKAYQEPTLVLFTGQVQSACGNASAAVGPFYCGADNSVYLDLSFFDELNRRFGAPGDFAQAYVIAHEIGHHVQNQLGIMNEVNNLRRQMGETEYNEVSVRLELQADFFAGVWAHHAQKMRQILEPGDIDEALRAATAIGDDALQRQAQGYVVPDSFTHGTSEQRLRWFKRGFESGRLSDGDTFTAKDL
jgi:predicted metalloprotease